MTEQLADLIQRRTLPNHVRCQTVTEQMGPLACRVHSRPLECTHNQTGNCDGVSKPYPRSPVSGRNKTDARGAGRGRELHRHRWGVATEPSAHLSSGWLAPLLDKFGIGVEMPGPRAELRIERNARLFFHPARMASRMFSRLCRITNLRAGSGCCRSGHIRHRRHTFAVEMLLAGVPIERVSILLGHRTVRTTERYYSKWVKERQIRLEAEVKDAWKKMKLPESMFAVQGSVQ